MTAAPLEVIDHGIPEDDADTAHPGAVVEQLDALPLRIWPLA